VGKKANGGALKLLKTAFIWGIFAIMGVLICGAFMFAIGSTFAPDSNSIPKDDTLIQQFAIQQTDFEALVRMMQADSRQDHLEKVALDYINYASNSKMVDDQHIEQYRTLLRELHALSIEAYLKENLKTWDSFTITVWVGGAMPDDGHYKSYEFFPDGLPTNLASQVTQNLDNGPDISLTSGTELYRKINAHWYLTLLW
jgi:hypothetical protein